MFLVGLDHEYLCRMLKRSTGFSLKRYIINEKMEAAKVLLENTGPSVALISERVGYANYSNFTRSFR
ncbi:helix-turn-helix domain-containing protein [Anaerocolumna jejuensis]|uniref:helix-turn-helix domain-containing protein n=1 Tax=Anaerocolumna jejuensis TaxID=259063 RepID=UPI003F7C98F3